MDGYVYAIRPDGTLAWRFLTGGPVWSSPALAPDGTLYIGAKNGYLLAIQTTSPGLADSPWPKFRLNERNLGSLLEAAE